MSATAWLVIYFIALVWAALVFGYFGHIMFDKTPR